MPTYPLPYRIVHFLNRQIAWADAVLAELEAFCAAGEDTDFEEALAVQQRRARETRDFNREYRGLHHEWCQSVEVLPEDREAITRLSREAQARMNALREAYDRAEAAAAEKQALNRAARDDLRRGRRSVNIYRPGTLISPGFVDKKA
jgi:hypothetical protein